MKRFARLGAFLVLMPALAYASQGFAPQPTTGTLSGSSLVANENTNEAALLSTSAGTSAPSYATAGTLWTDTTNTTLQIYDGSAFQTIGSYGSSAFTVPVTSGGTGKNAISANQVFLGTASNTVTATTIPDCQTAGGTQALNFTQSSHAFSCNAVSGGGSGGSPGGSSGNIQTNSGSGGFSAYAGLICASHKWLNTIDVNGTSSADCVQPGTADISGLITTSYLTTSLFPAFTGDVTTSAGAVATTVAKIQGTAVGGTTGSGNVMFSASPTTSGTLTGAAASFSGAVGGLNFTASGTGADTIPVGTTGQRPSASAGMIRLNSTLAQIEVYINSIWSSLGFGTAVPCIDGSTTGGNICPGDYNATMDGTVWTDGSIVLGYAALNGNTTDSYNTAVGASALGSMAGSQGYYAGGNPAYSIVGNGGMNTAIGERAMGNSTAAGATTNTAAVSLNTAAVSLNTAIGFTNLMNINVTSGTGGYSNTSVGEATGLRCTNCYFNVFVGNDILSQSGAGTGIHDTVILGAEAATKISGAYNTILGSHAGNGGSGGITGIANLILGPYVASTTLTSGQGNILLGTSDNVDTSTASVNDEFDVGGLSAMWMRADMTGGAINIHGAAPSVASGSGACGTSASVAGNNAVGIITVGSSTNGGVCTVTFSGSYAYPNAPACICQDQTNGIAMRCPTTTTTLAATGAISAGDKISYICEGRL